jgi:hypothetical protein
MIDVSTVAVIPFYCDIWRKASAEIDINDHKR